jgi:hypothetical protein
MTTRRQPRKTRSRASRARSEAPGVQAQRLARALGQLASGLPNPWDEATDYFHGFAAAMPARTALDAESLRQALGIGARYHIDLSPADQALAKLGKASSGAHEDIVAGFRQLSAVMRATLTDLSLAFARGKGVVRVRAWLFGRAEDGTLVGLRTVGTET